MPQEMKWGYYNHAILPTTAPHETVDESPLAREDFWTSLKGGGYPLLARWTTDFDCKEPTNWWYVIKDTPFHLSDVKSDYRYIINRGLKNFEVRVIEPAKHAEALYQVQVEAFLGYPAKYRPKADHDQFVAGLSDWQGGIAFAAFRKDDDSLAGYAYVTVHEGYVSLSVQKTKPSQEKAQVNAALVHGVLDYFHKELNEGIYIMDGERSILHETNFQDYLEKYFKFRKAYCRLHVLYRPGIRLLVACLYPMRGFFRRLSGIHLFYQLSSVLKMEEIARKDGQSTPVKEV